MTIDDKLEKVIDKLAQEGAANPNLELRSAAISAIPVAGGPISVADWCKVGLPLISQETLAETVGTTRSRVSFFMNRFRKLGFVDRTGGGALQVHSSLLDVVLHD